MLDLLFLHREFISLLETRYKLASANEGDKQQLRWLYNACRGIPQVQHRGVCGLLFSITLFCMYAALIHISYKVSTLDIYLFL